jgi:YbdK family carboxylate-amine ligase
MKIDYHSSPRSSVGVEWELMLIDRDTRELTSGAVEILHELSPEAEHPTAKKELLQSTIEIITGVCTTIGQATEDLSRTLEQLVPLAKERGLGLMCAGTHPITSWKTQRISGHPRYEKLVNDMQWLARRMQIFGVHVHVGVRSPDKAIAMVNALQGYIPHFLALSASSPYWTGNDTGLASARSKVFEALPTAGLPQSLDDWAEFERYMETLIRTETIMSIKEVWWDIRPHPTYGTVELRICDGLPTLAEVAMVAALSQCLVEEMDRDIDKGYTLPKPKRWVTQENKWRAARYGLDARIIVGDNSTQPVCDALAELVQDLRPTAERLGCAPELETVQTILDGGASYQRQRAVAAASGGDLTAVVDSLLDEFEAGHPIVLPPRPTTASVGEPGAAGAVS